MAIRTFPLVNQALGGKLKRRLLSARRAGKSNQTIADELAKELGIEISRETVRKWCAGLGLEKKAVS